MYEELVKRLREDESWVEQGTTDTEHEIAEHIKQATDAIDNLDYIAQTYAETVHELEEKNRWIPVTERLPENEVTVLVVRKFLGIKDCLAKTYVETAEYCYGDWVADSDEYKIVKSKHTDPLYWMPLPKPPKEET